MSEKKRPQKAYKNLDFLNSTKARPIRILAEFIEPQHRFLEYDITSTVVFFGSARLGPKDQAKAHLKKTAAIYEDNPSAENEALLSAARLQMRLSRYYEDAMELARMLTEWALDKKSGKQKIYVCSGGGP